MKHTWGTKKLLHTCGAMCTVQCALYILVVVCACSVCTYCILCMRALCVQLKEKAKQSKTVSRTVWFRCKFALVWYVMVIYNLQYFSPCKPGLPKMHGMRTTDCSQSQQKFTRSCRSLVRECPMRLESWTLACRIVRLVIFMYSVKIIALNNWMRYITEISICFCTLYMYIHIY